MNLMDCVWLVVARVAIIRNWSAAAWRTVRSRHNSTESMTKACQDLSCKNNGKKLRKLLASVVDPDPNSWIMLIRIHILNTEPDSRQVNTGIGQIRGKRCKIEDINSPFRAVFQIHIQCIRI